MKSPSSPAMKELHGAARHAYASFQESEAPKWVVVSCDVTPGAGERLFAAQIGDAGVYFAQGAPDLGSSEFSTTVGVGAAVHLRFEGEERFRDASHQIEQTFERIRGEASDHARLRFFGGSAFSTGEVRAKGCWESFGDASFLLPQIVYQDQGTSASLLVLIERDEFEKSLALAATVLEALDSSESPAASAEPRLEQVRRTEGSSHEQWNELIAGIKREIDLGRAEKIVAARRVTLELSGPPALEPVLLRLREQAPLCTRFAIRLHERIFFGASPERLLRKRGNQVDTEALAGSIDAALPDAAQLLLASEKDRSEHEYVVRAIQSALSLACDEIALPDAPEVRRLARILHLRTPIVGHLRGGQGLLELVDALHPTPAVGGTPRREAVEFIVREEATPRGWYASPVGWVNSHGDGEFVVALRSALLLGHRLHVYAGAGIVRDSEAGAEYAETELKLGGILGALGLVS